MQSENCTNTIYPIATRPQIHWRSWAVQGLSLVKRDAIAIVTIVATWDQRIRDRRTMAALDAQALSDIGLTSAQMRQETKKPFWKA